MSTPAPGDGPPGEIPQTVFLAPTDAPPAARPQRGAPTVPHHPDGPARELLPAPAESGEPTEEAPALPMLALREPVPDTVADPGALARMIESLAAGTGPVAIDAERAGGYRYSQRAYLLQFRRAGSGTHLLDPIACPDLAGLADVLHDPEWVLHAASQDLPCLLELGLRPTRLFDTELAARLLGHPRVGLATLLETELGVRLAKEHSAADWSTRPLPQPWLHYAALDVEVLLELRERLAEQLVRDQKLEWAEQEFSRLVLAPPAEPRSEPWRRTSGLHRIRRRRELAIVRSLWERRDALARARDSAPGRLLPDAAIVDIARAAPRDRDALLAIPGMSVRSRIRHADLWWSAVAEALALPETDLPLSAAVSDGPPPVRAWAERDPVAAARLTRAKESLQTVSTSRRVPVENLLTPDVLRRLCWNPPGPLSPDTLADRLRELGAREWQIGLAAEPLLAALAPEVTGE